LPSLSLKFASISQHGFHVFLIKSAFFRTRTSGCQFRHSNLKLGKLDIEFSLLGKHLGAKGVFFQLFHIVFKIVAPVVIKANALAQILNLVAGFLGSLPDRHGRILLLSQSSPGLKDIAALVLFVTVPSFSSL
jgi:hypothetical protein